MKTSKSVIIFMMIFIISLKTNAQEQSAGLIDTSLLKADYEYLLKTLEETHPNLYAYIPRDDFMEKSIEVRAALN